MIIPTEITKMLSIANSKYIWIYITIFFVLMYLLISLLTWSFIKPLKYLGIPTFIVGILLLIIRLLPNVTISFFKVDVGIIKTILPSILKPILVYGILCFLLGAGMITIYIIVNKKINKKL